MKSPNFSFLPDENLVSLASSAELFFRTHPVVSLFLLRRFGEILAQSIAAQLGIYTSEKEQQLDLLKRLSRHLPDNIEDMFHNIRKAGNDAVHRGLGNHEIALKMIQNSRNLAIWYYQSFINSNYNALTFIPPLDPEQETNQLKQELLLLRKEAEQSRFNELKAWNQAQKEAELKYQSQEEIAKLQQQLHQLQQENSLIPEIQAELYILRSEAQNNIVLNNQIKQLEKQLNNIKEKYEELQEKANQKTTTQKHKTQILMQQNAVNLISKHQKKSNSKINNLPTICLNPNCGKTIDNPQNYCTFCGNHLLLKNTYQPIQLLGEGGFGKVFKALNLDNFEDICIIKQLIFNVTHSQFPIISRLFEQEARQLKLLGEHPQIPRLIAHFEEENRYYIVQQFIEGKNLSDLYDLEGSFSQEQIRDFLKQMSEILEFIHKENVIHRDIKPENIIKTKDNKYFLIDFGISKQLSEQNPTVSKIMGTPYYASPEQMSYTQITHSSDIYSLGVTCISLLTGYFPNMVNQKKNLANLKPNNQWQWTHLLPENFDPNLISIIEKMVQYEPTQRYQSASHILTDLIYISIITEKSQELNNNSIKNKGEKITLKDKIINILKKRALPITITSGVMVISIGLIPLIIKLPPPPPPPPPPTETTAKKITLNDTIDGYIISNNEIEIFTMDQKGAYTIKVTREILNQLPNAPNPITLKGKKIEIYDIEPSLINGKNIINITFPDQLTIN